MISRLSRQGTFEKKVNSLNLPYTRPFLIAILLLFAASLGIPKGEDVLLINGAHTHFLDGFFKAMTFFGEGWWLVPLIGIALFIRVRDAFAISLAAVLNGVVISLLKRVLFTDLERPKKILDNELLHFISGVNVHSFNSFPSGHTATAFGIALSIALLSQKKTLSVFALLLALAVGYSRIYLAQHFLIDVTAGAMTGWFTTFMAWEITENVKMPAWTNRKLLTGGR